MELKQIEVTNSVEVGLDYYNDKFMISIWQSANDENPIEVEYTTDEFIKNVVSLYSVPCSNGVMRFPDNSDTAQLLADTRTLIEKLSNLETAIVNGTQK